MSDNPFENAQVIVATTRADLIESGDMVIVPEALSQEAGFKFEVGITRSLWETAVALRGEDEQSGQSIEGRIWDLLHMTALKAKLAHPESARVYPRVTVSRFSEGKMEQNTIDFIAHIGPGDNGEPVLTFMLPIDD